MDILLFITIIVISLLLFEVLKHTLFKSFSKTIFVILFILIVFFVIISTLKLNNDIKSDNIIIETGATIVDSIGESEFGEFIKDKFQDLNEYVTDRIK
ncbi:hypothetical protein J4438_03300 [Candidatus Woesearchaeota archaeon]|nr:hypothetical protein [Candidatus Woesearchaeota archaeon]